MHSPCFWRKPLACGARWGEVWGSRGGDGFVYFVKEAPGETVGTHTSSATVQMAAARPRPKWRNRGTRPRRSSSQNGEREERERPSRVQPRPRRQLGPMSGPQGGCKASGGGGCCPSNNLGERRRARPWRDRGVSDLWLRERSWERREPAWEVSARGEEGQVRPMHSDPDAAFAPPNR